MRKPVITSSKIKTTLAARVRVRNAVEEFLRDAPQATAVHSWINDHGGNVIPRSKEIVESLDIATGQRQRVVLRGLGYAVAERLPVRRHAEQNLVILAMIVAVELHDLGLARIGARIAKRTHDCFGAAIQEPYALGARDHLPKLLGTLDHDLGVHDQRAHGLESRHPGYHRGMTMSE